MKAQQLLAFFAVLFLGITPALAADDSSGKIKYTGTFTGLSCEGCEATVTKAIKKLEGVKTVKIAVGKNAKTRIVTVTSTKSGTSKKQVIEALGLAAKIYKCQEWKESKG